MGICEDQRTYSTVVGDLWLAEHILALPVTGLIITTSVLQYIIARMGGEYSVQCWQYWPDRREGQYRSREPIIFLYCPT